MQSGTVQGSWESDLRIADREAEPLANIFQKFLLLLHAFPWPIFNSVSDRTFIINTLQRQKTASGTTNGLKPEIEGFQTIILRTPPGAGSMPRAP